MIFKQQAGVYAADHQEIGRLDRVVIDPRTEAVTHLIIRYGLLSTPAKVVPVEQVQISAQQGLVLQLTATEFWQLPGFEENTYLSRRTMPGVYWPRSYLNLPLFPGFFDPIHGFQTQVNIPAGMVAVKEGAAIIALDGKRTGQLDQIVTTAEGARVTHIVILHGALLKARKLIPMSWIRRLSENEIHLTVNSHTVNLLPNHVTDQGRRLEPVRNRLHRYLW